MKDFSTIGLRIITFQLTDSGGSMWNCTRSKDTKVKW